MIGRIRNRLIGGLDKMFEDRHVFIKARSINALGVDGFDSTLIVIEYLKEWERAGLLKIIKPYDECEPEDICIKMLNFIDCGPPHDRFWENPHLIRQLEED